MIQVALGFDGQAINFAVEGLKAPVLANGQEHRFGQSVPRCGGSDYPSLGIGDGECEFTLNPLDADGLGRSA
jgi:hypothetical protein